MNKITLTLLISFVLSIGLFAQGKKKPLVSLPPEPTLSYDPLYFQAMKWRNIGPFRGGRSTAVSGVIGQTDTYYMGSTGGGLWKTTDAGATWRNISDGFFKTGSVGAIAVSASDPNVIYIGMGESPIRGVMTSHGDGVYKSTDAGKTWKHIGLENSRQISRMRIHPSNPDIVYAAVQGSPYVPTEDRGIYRSMNGGLSWEKVHAVDSRTGVSDLSMDASNPRILYAAYWEHQRLPWQMLSGGKGSGIWKSIDGGDTWMQLKQGLPTEIMGKIGVAVSPANPNRIYAIIESEKGGLYRSDDAGKKWELINDNRVLRARSWYYMHIYADPVNPDKVIVLNAPALQSTDGGKSFQALPTPHGDNHDLWINPQHPQIMINANDGGANISYNGGLTWSTQTNQPTAQFYRVNADNRFPYYVYGGQQDNTSVATPSAFAGPGIPYSAFYPVGGCESAYAAFDPDKPEIVYAGCYQGIITRYDHTHKKEVDVMAYPFLGLGEKPSDMKYRFNWNAPIVLSQHDKSVLYHAANKVLKSTTGGQTWTEISPDLTRNESAKQVPGGAPITNEGAGGENYGTIMYLAESSHEAKTLWTGSDDGLVHISRDGGATWKNVTPPNLPECIINSIEVSPHNPAKVYVVANRYKFNDFTPHIFVSTDYGLSWTRKVKGIADDAHVRVVREDPARKDLLYAGTETGLYISFDGGSSWSKFQLNLPIVPITDLKIHRNDLIASTAGRAFWILDDLTPLHQINESIRSSKLHLYQPRNPYLMDGIRVDSSATLGTNPDNGLVCYYYISQPVDSLALQIKIHDEGGKVIRTFSSKEKKKEDQASAKKGMNKIVWNLRKPDYEGVKGVFSNGGLGGYKLGPGKYSVKLVYGKDSVSRSFEVMPHPQLGITGAQYLEQQSHLGRVAGALGDLHSAVRNMRHIKAQIESFTKRPDMKDDAIKKDAKSLIAKIDSLEGKLIQTKQKTFQDVINYPNQLDAKLIHIQSILDEGVPPLTTGQKTRVNDLLGEWASYQLQIQALMDGDLTRFNQKIHSLTLPFIGKEAIKE